ncbi:MAG: hypothetical protein ACRD0A_17300 [Acidimicrobiales bacterium]
MDHLPRPAGDDGSARSLARQILDLNDEIADLDELIEPLVADLGARLLHRPCIGVETAGQLLVTAGDNPERLRSEAAWAMLCGVAPLPAFRYRLALAPGADGAAIGRAHRAHPRSLSGFERPGLHRAEHRARGRGGSGPGLTGSPSIRTWPARRREGVTGDLV